jgi:hypothetical protein
MVPSATLTLRTISPLDVLANNNCPDPPASASCELLGFGAILLSERVGSLVSVDPTGNTPDIPLDQSSFFPTPDPTLGERPYLPIRYPNLLDSRTVPGM